MSATEDEDGVNPTEAAKPASRQPDETVNAGAIDSPASESSAQKEPSPIEATSPAEPRSGRETNAPTEAVSPGERVAQADDPSADDPSADGPSADGPSANDPEVNQDGPPSEASLAEAKRAVEAIVLVAADPISSQLLAQLLELPVLQVDGLITELVTEYNDADRGFELVEVAGGWRYQTSSDLYDYVERFALDGYSNKLSKAALETLAIVAYKQPISRSQITAIRGVNADGVLKTLEARGYVIETGRDDGPGQAMLFGTTTFFLERLGINTVEDLPSLGDFVPSAEVLEILEESLRIEESSSDSSDVTEEE